MKRVLVISDTHGRNDDIEGVLAQVGHIDYMIHCGDLERGEEYVRSLVDCPVTLISGNNDYYLDLPMEAEIEIEGIKIWITHGHYYYVGMTIDYLREEGLKKGVDVVMFGHTHVPYFEKGDDLIILNPGSLTYPRQPGRKPTFLIMEIDDEGKPHFGHGYYTQHFDELNI